MSIPMVIAAGQELDLPAELAAELVRAGAAEALAAPVVETATRKRPATRARRRAP